MLKPSRFVLICAQCLNVAREGAVSTTGTHPKNAVGGKGDQLGVGFGLHSMGQFGKLNAACRLSVVHPGFTIFIWSASTNNKP